MKNKLFLVCGFFIVILAITFAACSDNDDIGDNNNTGGNIDEVPPHIHDWDEWGATTIEGTEQRECKTDPSHIEHRLTGTDRFTFTAASATSYRISKYIAKDEEEGEERKPEVPSGYVIIPAYYRPNTDGDHLASRGYLPVTEIGMASDSLSDGAFANTSLTAVNIPDTITSIGGAAFYNCSLLQSINIPTSVMSIGGNAFGYCRYIESIDIPDSVKTVGSGAFSGWTEDQIINIPFADQAAANAVWGYWLYNCDAIIMGNIPYDGTPGLAFKLIKDNTEYSVSGNKVKRGEVRIPASYNNLPVSEIGDYAFSETEITGITIPSSVRTIGGGAFQQCVNLTGIIIPSGVQVISFNAFWLCTNIVSITIPASVTYIGNNAFRGWTPSQTINIQGKASESEADNSWDEDWRYECDARINYLGGR